jgi:hypothetical protein
MQKVKASECSLYCAFEVPYIAVAYEIELSCEALWELDILIEHFILSAREPELPGKNVVRCAWALLFS